MTIVSQRSAPGVRVSLAATPTGGATATSGLEGRILSLVFEDNDRKADKATLTVDNRDLQLFERAELLGGGVLEVSWGYPGRMSPPRRVVVQKVTGLSPLTIEGHALSALMHRQEASRRFEQMKRSDVALKVAQEHGYEGSFVHIDDTEVVFDVIAQAGETDARLLKRLAAQEDFEFWVDDTGLHFHPRRFESPPPRVLHWHNDPGQGDFVSLRVESNLHRRAGKVTVKGRDPLSKETIEQSATSDDTPRATLAETIEVVDGDTGETQLEVRNASAVVRPTPATTAAEAKRQARAGFVRGERATLKLSGRVVGDPSLRAKQVVELRGLPTRLAGKYYLTTVRHRVDGSGYACDLQMVRDGFGPAQARAQGGTRNQGEVRQDAELTQVEVVDPDSGGTRIEYRREGRPVGGDDPEGLRSVAL